ncbi:MAG: hypothetical protein AAF657_02210 [Acidobacteriota bacterium]
MFERSEFCRSPEGADPKFDYRITLTYREAASNKRTFNYVSP